MRRFKLPPQILRLVLLALAIVGSYLVARSFLVPPSFGQYGWYRGNALNLIASREPVFAGKKACDECHSDILHNLAADAHKTLSCEACHGVCREHCNNPDILPDKTTGSHCIRCHEANLARPAWLKQIVVKDHYGPKCTECHLPHQPTKTP
ncbi:MAG: hypothetical protein ABSA45_00265 [Verrucomicrobiota bacterium]|jgi:hypothetical protein